MVHKLPLALISPVCVCQCVLCVMRRGLVFCLPRGCHCIVGISGEFSSVMNRLIWVTSSLAPHPFKTITPAGKHVWNSFSSWAGLRSEREREISFEEESPFGQKEKPTWKTGVETTRQAHLWGVPYIWFITWECVRDVQLGYSLCACVLCTLCLWSLLK